MSPILAAHAVSFRFGKRVVLSNISCQLHPGELVALIGPNGAGKTTLVKMLAGILRPHSGRVQMPEARARKLAYLAQAEDLPPEWKAHEVVELGRLPHVGLFGRLSRADETAVIEAMKRTHTLVLASRRISSLSGGERQGVALARALAQEPEALLLDEPASYLDLGRQAQLLATLRAEAQRGTAVLAVLHDLSLASQADRCLLLAQGALRAEGTPSQVLRPDLLRETYAVDVQVLNNELGPRAVVALAHGQTAAR